MDTRTAAAAATLGRAYVIGQYGPDHTIGMLADALNRGDATDVTVARAALYVLVDAIAAQAPWQELWNLGGYRHPYVHAAFSRTRDGLDVVCADGRTARICIDHGAGDALVWTTHLYTPIPADGVAEMKTQITDEPHPLHVLAWAIAPDLHPVVGGE